MAALMISFVFSAFYDRTYELIFISGAMLFSLFVFCFYMLTLTEEKSGGKVMSYPPLSVIIPSYNSERTIGKCLRHVLRMQYPGRKEVIVVDDASSDRTASIASGMGVRVIRRTKNRGKASALNEAIRQAGGELVACIDSDTYPPSGLLTQSVPYMHEKGLGALTFFINVHAPKTLWQKMQSMEYLVAFGILPYITSKMTAILVTPGPLSIFRKQALLKIGGFDENNIAEDFEMGLKLNKHGYKIRYLPIRVPTEVPSTFSGLMRQRLRWYRGTLVNLRLYKELLFNRKYSEVGMFGFPMVAAYVPITILSFFVFSSELLRMLYDAISSSFYFTLYWQWGGAFDPLSLGHEFVFFFSFFAIYVVFLSLSMSLINEKYGLSKVAGTLMVIFIYPITNSAFYALSLYKEIAGSEYRW